jgi:hypothetical protein
MRRYRRCVPRIRAVVSARVHGRYPRRVSYLLLDDQCVGGRAAVKMGVRMACKPVPVTAHAVGAFVKQC